MITDDEFSLDLDNTDVDKDNDSDTQDEVTFTRAEEQALDDGWLPLDEWVASGKDKEDWVSAKEFNFRGELMGRISSQSHNISKQNKEMDKLKNAIKALGEMNQKLSRKQYERFQKDLEAQKLDALESQDHLQVIEIDKQIEGLKDLNPDNTEIIPDDWDDDSSSSDTPELTPEVRRWLEKSGNKWYHSDIGMRGAADAYAVEFRQTNPTASDSEMLEYVDKQIIKEFPHKFNRRGSTQGNKRALAEGSKDHSTSNSKTTKYTVADLNDTQAAIGRTLVEEGTFKKMDDYIEQLAALGELG